MAGEVDRAAAVREVWKHSCDNLDHRQKEELWQVLLEFKNIIALTEEQVGLTHLAQHEIQTGDARPIKTHLQMSQQECLVYRSSFQVVLGALR